MAARFRQEMPPDGGFGSIKWTRTMPKKINGFKVFGGVIAIQAVATVLIHFEKKKKKMLNVEMMDGTLAMEPLIKAERERMLLRHLRKNRDEENELMKDVPGWETGMLYGEPVFHNKAGQFPPISNFAYYVHSTEKDMMKRLNEKLKH